MFYCDMLKSLCFIEAKEYNRSYLVHTLSHGVLHYVDIQNYIMHKLLIKTVCVPFAHDFWNILASPIQILNVNWFVPTLLYAYMRNQGRDRYLAMTTAWWWTRRIADRHNVLFYMLIGLPSNTTEIRCCLLLKRFDFFIILIFAT